MGFKKVISILFLIVIPFSLYAQNPAGMAVSLDGDGDYMFVGIAPALQILGDVTVEAWAYINSYPDTAYPNFAEIVVNAGPFPDIEENNALYTLAITSDSLADCYHENGAGINNTFFAKSKLPPGVWMHLAEVRDVTAQTYAVYINGVLDTIGSYANNPSGGSNSKFTCRIYFGWSGLPWRD